MKKIYGYKLIREYPGSPKEGTIAILNQKTARGIWYWLYNPDGSSWGFRLDTIDQYPDLWKPLYSDLEIPIYIGNDIVSTYSDKVVVGSSVLSREDVKTLLKVSQSPLGADVSIQGRSVSPDILKLIIRKMNSLAA